MERRTILALGTFVVIGLAAFLVMRTPQKGERVGPAPRPFPEIKGEQITELDLTSEKQEKTTLVKKDGAWRVQGAGAEEWSADAAAAKSLVEGLAAVTFGDIATEDPKKQDDMGVAEGKASRVIVKGAGGAVLADFFLGKPMGAFTMLRPAGKNEIWQAGKLFPYMVTRDTKSWRDHTIFEFPWNDADRLVVEAGADKLTVDKEAGAKEAQPKWKVANATGQAPATETLDGQQVTGCVQALASLRATDFAEDKKPEELGLDKPWLKLTAHVKDKDHTLLVGATNGDDVYVKSMESKTAYVVKKYAVERIAHKPYDYRDKTITKSKADDLAAIEIKVGEEQVALENASGTWKARGKAAVDQAKVTPIPGSFENLSGSGFAEDKTLGKLVGEVTLRGKDKKTTTLRIGAPNKEGDYRVQKVGAPDVFLVKKYTVDRFFKKPADLAPAPSAPHAAPPGTPSAPPHL